MIIEKDLYSIEIQDLLFKDFNIIVISMFKKIDG